MTKRNQTAAFPSSVNVALSEREEALLSKLSQLSTQLSSSEQTAEKLFGAYARSLPGTTLSERFDIDAVLALSGKSAVFQALDRDLSREVALKLSRKERQECVLPELLHPNIVRLLAKETTSEGLHLEVQELLHGCTVRELLDERGSLDFPQALAIVREVAKGLCYLHRRRIVHRDLKPENLFLWTTSDGALGLKLLDLSLATPIKGVLRDKEQVPGTPGYVAPERVLRGTYDESVDLFALGVVLFELLGWSPLLEHTGHGPVVPRLERLTANVPEYLSALAESLVARYSAERPSAPQVVRLIELYLPIELGALPAPPEQPPRSLGTGNETLESVEPTPKSGTRPPSRRRL